MKLSSRNGKQKTRYERTDELRFRGYFLGQVCRAQRLLGIHKKLEKTQVTADLYGGTFKVLCLNVSRGALLVDLYATRSTYSVTEPIDGSDDALCRVCKFAQTDAQVLASDIVCRSCVLFELFKGGLHFLESKV